MRHSARTRHSSEATVCGVVGRVGSGVQSLPERARYVEVPESVRMLDYRQKRTRATQTDHMFVDRCLTALADTLDVETQTALVYSAHVIARGTPPPSRGSERPGTGAATCGERRRAVC